MYEKLILEDETKGHQIRLTLSPFLGNEYIHLRKYYLNFEGEWAPSKDGISVPASLDNMYRLLDGMIELASIKEVKESLVEHILSKLQNNEQAS